jgi:hypothetical protein
VLKSVAVKEVDYVARKVARKWLSFHPALCEVLACVCSSTGSMQRVIHQHRKSLAVWMFEYACVCSSTGSMRGALETLGTEGCCDCGQATSFMRQVLNLQHAVLLSCDTGVRPPPALDPGESPAQQKQCVTCATPSFTKTPSQGDCVWAAVELMCIRGVAVSR